MVRHNPTGRKRERGVALIAALLSLMLLSAIALGMMYSANMETDINTNYRDSLKAEYAARAGIEEVRSRMKLATGATGAITLPTVMPASGAGVVYVLNPKGSETVAPWSSTNTYFDTELCHESYYSTISNPGAGVFCTSVPSGTSWRTTTSSADPNSGTSNAMAYKWVRIAFKGNGSAAPYYVNNSNASGTLATQVCWDSSNKRQILLPTGSATCSAASSSYRPVYMLTSLAVTQNGSRRVAQEEVTQLQLPAPPAAVTLSGSPTFGSPSSNPFRVNGNDQANPLCGSVTGPALHAVGVTNDPAVTSLTNEVNGPPDRSDHYTGLGGSDADISNVSSSLGSLGTTSGLLELTSLVKSVAPSTSRYTGTQTDIGIGSPTSPQITFVDGNLTLSGTQNGAGILFVTGTLVTSGNFSFKGLIYVVGDGVWSSAGGGNGRVDGSVFVSNIYNSTTHNDSTLLSTPGIGSVTLDWMGGGGNGIYYDSCWANKVTSGLGFTTISMKELPY
jgi:Tfp pilus assembly protein PilX